MSNLYTLFANRFKEKSTIGGLAGAAITLAGFFIGLPVEQAVGIAAAITAITPES